MALKGSIFDGYHEKDLFGHINSRWEKYFNIYPQLPLTKIFDIKTLNVGGKRKDFLLKTNIDYTICDKEDKPLLCIEFDGWSHGYNKGGEYIQLRKDSLRKAKLELKLKIAIANDFPFYIISYDEKKYISEKIHLTIVDGIIGQTIANKKFRDKINEYLKDSQSYLDSMNEYFRHEYIQDLITSIEVELELTWDPIAKMASEIEHTLYSHHILTTCSYKPLSKPELPEIKDIFDTEGLRRRLKAWKNIEWQGCEVSCETPKGKVTKRAWVRNFEGMTVSPIIIVRNIAELLAFYKAANLNGIVV